VVEAAGVEPAASCSLTFGMTHITFVVTTYYDWFP
jgi:hypothetical protein